jgi:di/tricarboxylate transporter
MDSPRVAVLIVLMFVCLVSTFVSHTVAALILIPLVLKLGVSMHIPAVMVICSAFAGMYSSIG